jgi:hypothetical protein
MKTIGIVVAALAAVIGTAGAIGAIVSRKRRNGEPTDATNPTEAAAAV